MSVKTSDRPSGQPARRHTWLKRAVLPLSVLLIGTLVGLAAIGYLGFARGPANAPKDFLDRGRAAGTRHVVVSAGASVTAATLSADWVGKLRDRLDQDGYEFVNAGINGNTSADLLRRLDSDLIACQPDAVTLLVGTNDVRDGVPLARYREDLNTILDRLRAGMSARIAVLSLPPLGEDLDGAMNQRLTGYNDVIKELAEAPGVADLPLHERLVDLIRQHGDGQPYDFSFGRSYGAALDHYVFGKSWDEIADGNGLRVLTDHVHLSDRGGAVVAELVADWLCTAR